MLPLLTKRHNTNIFLPPSLNIALWDCRETKVGIILFNSLPSDIPGNLFWSSCPKLHFTFFSLMCVWLWPIYQPAHSHSVSLLLLHQSETERNKLKVHPKKKGLHSRHRKTLLILVTFPEIEKILHRQGISFLVEFNEFKFDNS